MALRASLGQALDRWAGHRPCVDSSAGPYWRSGADTCSAAMPKHNAMRANTFSIRIWSAPGTLANYALIGWFIGLQNARVPLYIFLTINLTNIALDLFFVIVLGMKVDGVALASVIAEYSGLLVGASFAIAALETTCWPLALPSLDQHCCLPGVFRPSTPTSLFAPWRSCLRWHS